MGPTVMIVLIAIAVLALVLSSLLGTREVWDLDAGQGALAKLRKRKDRALRILVDLDEARASGSLEEEEFVKLRNDYKRQAIQLLRELDRLRAVRLRHLSVSGGTSRASRRRVEDLLARRRSAAQGKEKSVAGDVK